MSVFLTPDLKPFYGGTYFPPEDRYGKPGFRRLLTEIARLWENDRKQLEKGATELLAAMRRANAGDTGSSRPDKDLLVRGQDALRDSFDVENGGFGGAPKFPPSMALDFLLRRYQASGDLALSNMVERTLDKMLQGGIHDHVGGGFHRYSVDDIWLVPHFEKMLYDNALLARIYTEALQLTSRARYADVARSTLDFMLRDLRDAGGAFHASWDADSEGQEGKYYLWQQADIEDLLPAADINLFCRIYGMTPKGNFEGATILHQSVPLAASAKAEGIPLPDLKRRMKACLDILLQARNKRIAPHRDDKVLTNWNALALSALARAAAVFDDAAYLRAARRTADFLLHTMRTEKGLFHSWRQGHLGAPGNLDDYAYLTAALLDLYHADPNPSYVVAARELGHEMLSQFYDGKTGRFYFVEENRPHLITREQCAVDSAIPAAGPVAANALIRLGRLTDDPSAGNAGETYLKTLGTALKRFPAAHMAALTAVSDSLNTEEEVIIAGDPDAAETQAMAKAVRQLYRPTLLLCQWNPSGAESRDNVSAIPLFKGRTMVKGLPTAYVCRNRTCQAPVTSVSAVKKLLGEQTSKVGR